MIQTKRLFKFCLLFFLCFQLGIAQVNTKKHTVTLGETVIEIAKRYNVTPYDILQANLSTINTLDDIKENDVLIIPESKINTPQLESAAEAIKSSVVMQPLSYTVKNGDTKFGLAKRFGMTIAELEALNPQIVAGLNEGAILKLSTSAVIVPETSAITESKAPTNETYLVKNGDTKYSLAKKYDITIEALERLNPQIVQMLQTDQILRVPSTAANQQLTQATKETVVETTTPTQSLPEEKPVAVVTEKITNPLKEEVPVKEEVPAKEEMPVKEEVKVAETPTVIEVEKPEMPISQLEKNDVITVTPATQIDSSPAYINYEIKSNETLYGLSKKAGMSIEDFIALNPQVRQSVQSGTIVKMPSTVDISKENNTNQTPLTSSITSPYKDLSKTIITSKSEKLLFFLPFTEAEFNEEASSSKKFSAVSDDFKREHLEFYSGAKIALDSLKKLGVTVEVTILESENNKRNEKLMTMAKDEHVETYDAILLPFYTNADELATIVAEERVPVITAAQLSTQQNVDNLFAVLPSVNEQRQKMLDFMIAKQGNIIVVNDTSRTESKEFISKYAPSAQFVTIKNNGNFYDNDLISLFKPNQLNYVILDSNRNSVFLNVTNILLSELNSYNLQLAVLEPSLIPDTDDVSVKRYRILKMLFPSLTTMETNMKPERFSDTYKKVYNLSPSTNAILGFDITFDTLLRLSQAQSFEESAKNDITEYVNMKVDYKRNSLGGYTNEGIYILQYDTDSNIRKAN